MNLNTQAARDWLGNLSARERNLVYAAAGLGLLALLYLVLVLPFTTTSARMAARVEKKTADLAWMQAQAPRAMAAAGMTQATSGESLVVVVDRTARQAGLGTSLRDQSPSGNAGLRLRLEAASFDTLVTWLVVLQQQHGVTVESATIDAAGPGLVNATLSLTQAGASAPMSSAPCWRRVSRAWQPMRSVLHPSWLRCRATRPWPSAPRSGWPG